MPEDIHLRQTMYFRWEISIAEGRLLTNFLLCDSVFRKCICMQPLGENFIIRPIHQCHTCERYLNKHSIKEKIIIRGKPLLLAPSNPNDKYHWHHHDSIVQSTLIAKLSTCPSQLQILLGSFWSSFGIDDILAISRVTLFN